MKYFRLTIWTWLLAVWLLAVIAIAQTKPATLPATAPTASPAPKSTIHLTFLDGTYLWDAKANAIAAPGLGMNVQPCPLISMHSGVIRDSQGAIISNRPMLEPTLDVGVLADALRPFPQGGWVVLDAEGCVSYGINEALPHDANVSGFAHWQKYIAAVRFIRPDLKIAAIMGGWHSPNMNPIPAGQWAESEACTKLFKDTCLPLLLASGGTLAVEVYYIDRPSPPSTGDPEIFNMHGVVGTPGWGFAFNCCVENNYIRALTGKPAVNVLCITPAYGSRPETDSKLLSGPRMAACLDVIAQYQPAAVMLWGSSNSGPVIHTLPTHEAIGVFNPADELWAEVKKRNK